MIQQMTNRELAQEISARIGNAPIPFDSVYSIALQIYQELGGEETQFDSVYSILLEILPLVHGGSDESITEVEELPNAQENKNSIYRLSSDDKVYMSKFISKETTNRLPDEQQIDKGSLNNYGDTFYYNSAWKIILNDGELDCYGWIYKDGDYWILVVTQDNAVYSTGNTKCYVFTAEDETVIGIDFENHTITYDDDVSQMLWEDADTLTNEEYIVIPAIYNASEADCIAHANFGVDGDTMVYTGQQETFEVGGETITVYKWQGDGWYIGSTKPASEIYYDNEEDKIYTDTIFYDLDDYSVWDEMWNMYIPQLNAPESEQIRKAYIEYNDDKYYYRGECTVQCTNRVIDLYWWCSDDEFAQESIFLTEDSANSIHENTMYALYGENATGSLTYVDEQHLTYSYNSAVLLQDFDETGEDVNCEIIKYTRVLNENWEWQEIPTMDDLSSYATKTYVDTNLDLKADKTYVDTNFAKVVSLTQAQYDALVSGGTVDAKTLYIITDAQ